MGHYYYFTIINCQKIRKIFSIQGDLHNKTNNAIKKRGKFAILANLPYFCATK